MPEVVRTSTHFIKPARSTSHSFAFSFWKGKLKIVGRWLILLLSVVQSTVLPSRGSKPTSVARRGPAGPHTGQIGATN